MFKLFRKNNIVIYTVIFGKKDNLREPLHKIMNADLICFTDSAITSKNWKIIQRTPENKDLTRAAKRYKVLGDKILNKYKYTIWIDGRILLKLTDAKVLVQKYLEESDIALFSHPEERDCIYDELDILIKYNEKRFYDNPEIMKQQIDMFYKEGFPKHAGLIAGGFIIRKNYSPIVKTIMDEWWKIISTYSKRDQLSFNYIMWKLKKNYTVIPGNIRDNEYCEVGKHNFNFEPTSYIA